MPARKTKTTKASRAKGLDAVVRGLEATPPCPRCGSEQGKNHRCVSSIQSLAPQRGLIRQALRPTFKRVMQKTEHSRLSSKVSTVSAVADILQQTLESRDVDIVIVVNGILAQTPASGVRCTRHPDKWVIEGDGFYQELKAAPRSLNMLRLMCARLAVLSLETTGRDTFLYGGEGDILLPKNGQGFHRFHVQTMNTPGEQWFEITPIQDEA